MTIKEKSRRQPIKLRLCSKQTRSRPVPKWLDLNRQTNEAKVIAVPERSEDIDLAVEETLIVELYSK